MLPRVRYEAANIAHGSFRNPQAHGTHKYGVAKRLSSAPIRKREKYLFEAFSVFS
jgi:hypothetical protein